MPASDSAPKLIGVIDLMEGRVVRAVGGRRESYRPWISPLTGSSNPVEIAQAFAARFEIERLYVADLDALQGRRADRSTVAALVAAGFHVTLDAGPRSRDEIAASLALGVERVVLPLERLANLADLAAWCEEFDADRLVFGLDLDEGIPRAEFDVEQFSWHSPAPAGESGYADCETAMALGLVDAVRRFGLRHLIILDLAAVGRQRGLATIGLCTTIHGRWPEMTIWSGGGVDDQRDVLAARDAGINGLLVATALHEGGIETKHG